MEIDSGRGSLTSESSAPASTKKAQRHGLMDLTSIWRGRRAIKKSIRAIKVPNPVCVFACVCLCECMRADVLRRFLHEYYIQMACPQIQYIVVC